MFGSVYCKPINLLFISLLTLPQLALSAETGGEPATKNQFITLGTAGGPEAELDRAQPANALIVGTDVYLVDAGDGAAGQLKKAGFRVPQVKALFISHNHFDHTGGVLALLGLRMQLNAFNPLTVYGPPGTAQFINGLLTGMEQSRQAAYGMPGVSWVSNIDIIELEHGSVIELEGLTVTTAENSHFVIPDESSAKEKAKSLSFRFDLEDRSIVFTGDTGPSDAVIELATGADILISEMMDIPAVLETVKQTNPNMPAQQLAGIEWHFRAHHVLPIQVGEMAKAAGVSKVIITHMAPNVSSKELADRYTAEISENFSGKIVIAKDLDNF